MDAVWHNVIVDVLGTDDEPIEFEKLLIETRSDSEIIPLGELGYDQSKRGVYSFQYALKRPDVVIWLSVLSGGSQDTKRISVGTHRYIFRVCASGKNEAVRRPIQVIYKIGTVGTLINQAGVNRMAKGNYKATGGSSIVGENATGVNKGSFNKSSQVSLSPAVEEGFKKMGAVAKKSKNEAVRKDLQSLKREAKKNSPDKSKMKGIWDGIVKAAPGVVAEAGKQAVDAIAGIFT